MSLPKLSKRRNRMHTCRAATGTPAAPGPSPAASSPGDRRSVTRQPLSATSQRTNAPTASGSEASMAEAVTRHRP